MKILGTFKLPRAEEIREREITEAVVRGPLYWLTVGDKKPSVFAPGTEGATSQAWARMTVRDRLKWWAGIQDRHYKEFWFQGSVLDGRWIVGYVPTAAGVRQWMVSRPAKQTPDSEFLQDKFGHLAKASRISLEVKIAKADEERHLVYGVVLQPEIPDLQGDIVSPEVIEKACHEFMLKSRIIGLGHRHFTESADLKIVECFIAPTDMILGKEKVVKGSWILVVYVGNPRIWKMVKEGKLTGFSISGTALV